MKSNRLLLAVLLSFSATAATACSATSSDDDAASADDEIVRFPAAVFANATPIVYGQTLTNVSFKSGDQFRAVRFSASKGDRVEGTATAASGKSIVYLARKVGGTYVNVRAGGQDGALPHVLVFTIEELDEYFLVFRTVPRADSTFSVSLAKLVGAAGACADAGKLPSVSELADVARVGENPTFTTKVQTRVERRECVYATGCGPVTDTFGAWLGSLEYRTTRTGATWSTVSKLVANPEQPRVTFGAAGNVNGVLTFAKYPQDEIPVRGSIGPTCTSLDETILKVPAGASYVEYRVVPVPTAIESRTAIPHPATPSPAVVATITPARDEVILARFPRGQEWTNFAQPLLLRGGVGAGTERTCHPLTSCTVAAATSYLRDACSRLERSGQTLVHGATVTGADSYALNTSAGPIGIEDGIGRHDGMTVRVSESQLQFELAASTEALSDGVVRETSNSTCTFALAWP